MKKILVPLLVILSSFGTGAQKAKDSIAIKNVLEKEAATWRSGDVKAHAGCWLVQPYSRILVSTADGNCYDVAPENVVNPPAGMMGKGGYAILSNFTFSIQKRNAWVSHDEVSVAADGSKSYSHEIRLLEKIKGQWKLVGQSIHIYKPG
ncbi:MAG: hypothetical protein J0L56_16540 [Chitinophagales bacterium]|nr:hypothetical protein [Chitinophagales bacterium]